MTTVTERSREAWGSDFFGTLNTLPPETVALVAGVLEAMATEPTFQRARREMLADLHLRPTARVLDAGCGTGAALPDLLEVGGRELEITGVDPTDAFLERARQRANELGARACFESGDIRALPVADGSVDAAYCDKVLLHVGPASAALGEMVRATRPGGRIGAVEWFPVFCLATSRPELAAALNDALRRAVYDVMVSANLARHFREAGLTDVTTRTYVAHASRLDEHPFWKAFLVDQLPLFAHAGLISEEEAGALAADLEDLDCRGVFSAAAIVRSGVGTRP
jgi:ubiquinone/menaquinone biosynthesis C-methylase UbiE